MNVNISIPVTVSEPDIAVVRDPAHPGFVVATATNEHAAKWLGGQVGEKHYYEVSEWNRSQKEAKRTGFSVLRAK